MKEQTVQEDNIQTLSAVDVDHPHLHRAGLALTNRDVAQKTATNDNYLVSPNWELTTTCNRKNMKGSAGSAVHKPAKKTEKTLSN